MSPWKRGVLFLAFTFAAFPLCADEIRLKDGKKLFGVIVAYDEKENLFKVKTDFGYVLVEKDKIASIIPVTPAPKPDVKSEAKPGSDNARPAGSSQPKAEPAVASSTEANPSVTIATAKTPAPSAGSAAAAPGKSATSNTKTDGAAGARTDSPKPNPQPSSNSAAPQTPAQAPKQPEVPAIREDVQANVYTNYTNGFRMYKAPSWELIPDARNALPNAIVGMGTPDQSTLLVVGREQTKQPLDAAANTVEKRLRDVYENYRQVSHRKTTVGGSPAVEFRFLGKAADHDWSGTLVIVARGTDIFTVLGMTYADSDLIQIQENVITKAVASVNFDVH